jgi:hypothetical protein
VGSEATASGGGTSGIVATWCAQVSRRSASTTLAVATMPSPCRISTPTWRTDLPARAVRTSIAKAPGASAAQ